MQIWGYHCSALLSIAQHCSALLSIAQHCSALLSIAQPHCVKWILNAKLKIPFQFLDICFKFIRQKYRQLKNETSTVSFCKSRLSKMTSIKTNKNKKGTPVL